jgi:cysteine desulfurase
MTPYIYGGGQEKGIRSGTENIPGIAGLARAAELSYAMLDEKKERLITMRQYLKNNILKKIDDVTFIGHPEKRLPGNCNFSFKNVEGEAAVLRLDNAGIAVSSGSACATSSTKPSHALVALGLSGAGAAGSLRITLGFENTYEEIDYFLEAIDRIIRDLRKISPAYKKN